MFIKKKSLEDNPYKKLQEESLKMIQQLSGNRWTDYNDHDPGVTIMDILNYALLELQHVCSLPLEEYLPMDNLSDRQTGLFSPDAIFSPSIVTPEDYCRVITDTFEEMTACSVVTDNSLLHICLTVKPKADTNRLIKKVSAWYHRHRNLCENLGRVTVMQSTVKQREQTVCKEEISFNPIVPNTHFSLSQKLQYRSVQYDFPDCYGVNEKGLAPNTSPEDKTAAWQLKAYLLIFDYLLSGANQQILSISRLLNLSADMPPQFKADVQIKDIERLLDETRESENKIFDLKQKLKQKTCYFDSLDRMYGEDTSVYVQHIEEATERLACRAMLIGVMPALNTARFRSFDLQTTAADNQSGIEQFLSLILGFGAKQIPDDERIYVVEHILLIDENNNLGERNKLTFVFPDVFKEHTQFSISDIVEERLPAHILWEIQWLNAEEMMWFRSIYSNWRSAWAVDDKIRIKSYSDEIKKILPCL